jgi:hypothetical protein
MNLGRAENSIYITVKQSANKRGSSRSAHPTLMAKNLATTAIVYDLLNQGGGRRRFMFGQEM